MDCEYGGRGLRGAGKGEALGDLAIDDAKGRSDGDDVGEGFRLQ